MVECSITSKACFSGICPPEELSVQIVEDTCTWVHRILIYDLGKTRGRVEGHWGQEGGVA